MSKTAVVSGLSLAFVASGMLAVYLSFGTFAPVVSGTGDATAAGVTLSGGAWLATIVSGIASIAAFYHKYEDQIDPVAKKLIGVDISRFVPDDKSLGDGAATIQALVAYKVNPKDQAAQRAAFMAIMTLLDDVVAAEFPTARPEVNALGQKVMGLFFPVEAPKV